MKDYSNNKQAKTHKQLPDWALYLPVEKQKKILHSLFTYYGYYNSISKTSHCSTTSKDLADQIQHLLRRSRIRFNCSTTRHYDICRKWYRFVVSSNIAAGEFLVDETQYYNNKHLLQIGYIKNSNYDEDVWCVTVDDDNTITTKIGATKNCEGLGMPAIEAASCGIPIASVDYSAMTEVCRNVGGTLIPVERFFRETETNADRAYPDNNFTVQLLVDFFNKPSEKRTELGKTTREKCISTYTWDKVYEVWDEIFSGIDITKKVSWDDKETFTTNHQGMSVPPNLGPREFVEYICTNVINEPYLINTAPVQNIIKDLSGKMLAKGGSVKQFWYPEAINLLEHHLNNKILHEHARHNQNELKRESYLTCQMPTKN